MMLTKDKSSNTPQGVAYAGDSRAPARPRMLDAFYEFLGPSTLERLVNSLLIVAAANVLVVLMTGGYMVAAGPLRLGTRHLRDPLTMVLVLSLARTWLRGGRSGVPARIRLRAPLLLFLGVLLIYGLIGRTRLSDDTIPARYLPLSILREFDFDLDEFPFLYEPQVPYYLTKSNGHVVSTHPPWASVLALPVYLLPVMAGRSAQSPLLPELEKVAAALITALSVLLLFFALRRITRERNAWLIALIYAFGTSSLSISSQGLWQHGPSQLFLALMIYFLLRGLEESRFSAYAGFALAGAIICRPINVLIAPPIVAYILQHRRGGFFRFALWALPPLLLFAGYNYYYFGSPFTTGVAAFIVNPSSVWRDRLRFFGLPLWDGLMGMFASPGRGLFVYSPILILSFIGMAMAWRARGDALFRYLSVAALLEILLVCKWGMWWGGHTYGPRLLADLTPIFCLYLYPVFEWLEPKSTLRYAVAGLAVLSVGLHALGASSDGSWNNTPANVDDHPERLWSWAASPPLYYLNRVRLDAEHALARLAPIPTPQEVAAQTFISRMYQEILARPPEPDERVSWAGFLIVQCNATGFQALTTHLLNSEEFWRSRPLSPDLLVTILYRGFLGRDPDPAALAYWRSQVRAAALRVATQGLLPSAEFQSLLPDRSDRAAVGEVIARFYTELLGRTADPAGLAYWVNYVASTHDLVEPGLGFLISAEFDDTALPLQRYVTTFYRAFLGRQPDPRGLEFWEGTLRANLETIIQQGFTASEELTRLPPLVCGKSITRGDPPVRPRTRGRTAAGGHPASPVPDSAYRNRADA